MPPRLHRPLILLALGIAACAEPEPAEVVARPPTLVFALEPDGEGGVEAVFDLANPNGFPIELRALHVGVDVAGASDALCLPLVADGCDADAPDWPAGADLLSGATSPPPLTIPPRETTACHAALENCQVIGAEFCCDRVPACEPLGDCFGRVTPEGSRCLVCPSHVEVRVPLVIAGEPSASRGAAVFSAPEPGRSLVVDE